MLCMNSFNEWGIYSIYISDRNKNQTDFRTICQQQKSMGNPWIHRLQSIRYYHIKVAAPENQTTVAPIVNFFNICLHCELHLKYIMNNIK